MPQAAKSIAKSAPQALDVNSLPWSKLTWDDLETWAGTRSLQRGKTYANTGRVNDLSITADHILLATVRGTKRYTVQVPPPQDGHLGEARCTCPVGYRCKHAIATVVAYLSALADGKAVASITPDDRRLKAVLRTPAEAEDSAEDEDDNAAWDDEYAEAAEAYEDDEDSDSEETFTQWDRPRRRRSASAGVKVNEPQALRTLVESKDHAELVTLVVELAAEHPKLAHRLQDEWLLGSGDAGSLLQATRQDIRKLTGEQSWWRHWERRGNLPDFAPLREKFQRLDELGFANHLLELGVELLKRGLRQIEQSDDDGHVAGEIRDCLELVFDALPKSGLSDAEKLLFAVYAMLVDDYGICETARQLLEDQWSAADWSKVANVLCERLRRKALHRKEGGIDYRRKQLVDFAVRSLQASGRAAEIFPLAESEARDHGEYDRVIELCLEREDLAAAETWLRAALAGTDRHLAGLVSRWRAKLKEIATRRQDWWTVASHAAEEFFEAPSVATFRALMTAADKFDCCEVVRAGAIEFLATGKRPTLAAENSSKRRPSAAKQDHRSDWPLATPDYFRLPPAPADKQKRRPSFPAPRANWPRPDVLLEIAIDEKRPDDVLALYEQHLSEEARRAAGRPYYYASDYAPRVAAFVAPTHPEQAATLYENLIIHQASQVGEPFYRNVVGYLKSLRPITAALGQPARFDQFVARICHEQRRKSKLIEMLQRLHDRPIVEQKRSASGAPK